MGQPPTRTWIMSLKHGRPAWACYTYTYMVAYATRGCRQRGTFGDTQGRRRLGQNVMGDALKDTRAATARTLEQGRLGRARYTYMAAYTTRRWRQRGTFGANQCRRRLGLSVMGDVELAGPALTSPRGIHSSESSMMTSSSSTWTGLHSDQELDTWDLLCTQRQDMPFIDTWGFEMHTMARHAASR